MIKMKLSVQKRLAKRLLNSGKKRVRFDNDRLEEIKDAITAADMRALIKDGAVIKSPVKGTSKSRSRIQKTQKKKGRRKGQGSRKGNKTARTDRKETWMNKIRAQRKLLAELRETGKITKNDYTRLYRKSNGGFFRSKRHIMVYCEELGLIQTEAKETKNEN